MLTNIRLKLSLRNLCYKCLAQLLQVFQPFSMTLTKIKSVEHDLASASNNNTTKAIKNQVLHSGAHHCLIPTTVIIAGCLWLYLCTIQWYGDSITTHLELNGICPLKGNSQKQWLPHQTPEIYLQIRLKNGQRWHQLLCSVVLTLDFQESFFVDSRASYLSVC